MNKLQLYIYKSLRGFKSVQNINPADNILRHIRDARPAVETIDYDPSEKYLFYLLSYIEKGTFLSILRTIPSKPDDHLASTIFIPNGLIISSRELKDIVDRAARMLSNPSMSAEQVAELHELFSKEYPVDQEAPAVIESLGREYAYSYYGGETGRDIGDFFGDRIYQTEFLKYAGVLLVDADLGVSVDAVDLTDEPLYDPATLLPPEPSNGFVPYIYNRQFDRPFRVSLGKEAEIIWRRKGFDDIRQTVEVTDREQKMVAESLDSSRKTINRSSFYVSAGGGKNQIEDVEITVNGIEITDSHSFSFDELKNANVSVNAPGYRPYHATMNLAATSQALISLNEQKRIYGFELPVKSSELGSPIRFEIHTKRQLSDSPLEGYSLIDEIREGSGRYNHLLYTGQSGIPVRQTLIYVGGALIAGFLLGWLLLGGGKSNKTEAPEPVTEQIVEQSAPKEQPKPAEEPTKEEVKPAEQPKQQDSPAISEEVTAASISYLDANQKWTREDLEKQPGLAGLFDDINNFRLERLNSYWGPRLSKSKRFEKVAYHAGESLRKKIFSPQGTYCKDGDNAITVQNYLYRIDPAKN